MDPNITSTHVSGGDELDHVLKNYPQDVEGWVEAINVHASYDFHVLDGNINFALVQEVNVKAS